MIAAADFGGAESVVQSLATGRHAAMGCTEVALLLQHDRPSPLAEALRAAGVPVTEIRCGRRRYWSEARQLTSRLRAAGVALVHSHVYQADFVASRAARNCGLPTVSTVHGFAGGSAKNRIFEWYDRRLLRRFDRVICVAEAQRAFLTGSGVDADRIRVVRNGLAPPEFLDRRSARQALGLNGDGPIVGWLGRLSSEKGPDLFVRAMSALGRRDVTGAMIGDGGERESVHALIASTGASVDMLGRVTGAARTLRAFDVIALTSRTEGTPMLLLEAMAAGVPTACFAVGGVPGVLDAESSWLVTPTDVEQMARAIASAVDDRAEAARRADAASRRLQRDFGLDAWLAAVETVYDEALAPK